MRQNSNAHEELASEKYIKRILIDGMQMKQFAKAPLIITEREIDEIFDIIEKSVKEVLDSF